MSIYKDCDVRGIYQKEFDERDAYSIGRALGTKYNGKTLAVGGDVRISTPVLKQSIMDGMRESGANLIDLGMVPTPVFYYALKKLDVVGGVQVTASHNPPQYNGFKLMFGEMPITPEVIADLENAVKEADFTEGNGTVESYDITTDYFNWITKYLPQGNKKVVLDACNGAMSELAPKVFKALGYDVVELFCTFDGNFPNRDPNPAVYSHLSKLCEKVKETNADYGAAFDGDGDRMVFVDNEGNVVQSERSFVVFIDEYLKNQPSSVVYDQKSSSIVRDAILKHGGEPRMERSGHAFIKRNFLEHNSALAGEISGHFFFGEIGYDDGLYAALKMGEILSNSADSFSEIVNKIPRTLITPDIRCFCRYSERDAWLEKVRELGRKYEITELDGVRVQFPDGWLLVRKSVTEEGITARIEANDAEAMAKIKNMLAETLPEIKEKL